MTHDDAAAAPELRLIQIAISSLDPQQAGAWWHDVLGFEGGGSFDPAETDGAPDVGDIQGLPGAALRVSFLLDQQAFFQYEVFRYRSPESRPMPADRRPCDVGYAMIGVHVDDFDGTLERLAASGTAALAAPVGAAGSRRVTVRDPDGVVVELMEDDPRTPSPSARPRPEIGGVTRSITVSVPDLARSLRFFVDTIGLRRAPAGVVLHGPEHEAAWGLDGAQRQSELLWAGDVWIELVEYRSPRGAPWPADYRLSDQGILNVALGSRSRDTYERTIEQVRAAGYRTEVEVDLELNTCLYVVDDQGFSVELLYVSEAADELLGFVPISSR